MAYEEIRHRPLAAAAAMVPSCGMPTDLPPADDEGHQPEPAASPAAAAPGASPVSAAPAGGGGDLAAAGDAPRSVDELDLECFRQLVDNVSDVLYVADLRWPRILYVSSAYERVWERSVSSLHEQPGSWISAVHPDDRQRVEEVVSRDRHLGWDIEYRLPLTDGTVRWIWDRSFPVRDAQGVPYCVAGVARDVTERRQAEAVVLRAKEEAERASLAKSALLANMSHELVTPLHAVIGFSELLVEGAESGGGALDQIQAQYVGNILTSGRRLLALVRDLLDLAKIEAGRLTFELQRTDLAALLVEIAASLAIRVHEQGLELGAELEPGLPPVEVDPGRLRQVILQLVDNALKFTPAGGSITIHAGAWRGSPPLPAGPAICVTVADTGAGIAAADHERIFAVFEQLDAGYDRGQQGGGLGLALARRLVELHGGRLWVESAGPGRGSEFRFLLPVRNPISAA